MPRPGRKRLVCGTHFVKFCPPSECTGGQAVAVVDYRLVCGHTLRRYHYAGTAHKAHAGVSVAPSAMVCPVCSRGGCACTC